MAVAAAKRWISPFLMIPYVLVPIQVYFLSWWHQPIADEVLPMAWHSVVVENRLRVHGDGVGIMGFFHTYQWDKSCTIPGFQLTDLQTLLCIRIQNHELGGVRPPRGRVVLVSVSIRALGGCTNMVQPCRVRRDGPNVNPPSLAFRRKP